MDLIVLYPIITKIGRIFSLLPVSFQKITFSFILVFIFSFWKFKSQIFEKFYFQIVTLSQNSFSVLVFKLIEFFTKLEVPPPQTNQVKTREYS